MGEPIQIIGDDETGNWHRDAYRLEAFAIDGDTLRLTVSYTGGCQPHRFEVLARKITIGSERLEAELSVSHDAQQDSCKALIRRQLEFSLAPLLSLSGKGLKKPQTLVLQLGGRALSRPLLDDVPPADEDAAPPTD